MRSRSGPQPTQSLGEPAGGPDLGQRDVAVVDLHVEDLAADGGTALCFSHAQAASREFEHALCHALYFVQDPARTHPGGPPVGDRPLVEEPRARAGEEGDGPFFAESTHEHIEVADDYPGSAVASELDDRPLELEGIGVWSTRTGIHHVHPVGDHGVVTGENDQGPGLVTHGQKPVLEQIVDPSVVANPHDVVAHQQPAQPVVEGPDAARLSLMFTWHGL